MGNTVNLIEKLSDPDAGKEGSLRSVYGNVFEYLILFVLQPLTALAKLQTLD
jgi:hypothetical protein